MKPSARKNQSSIFTTCIYLLSKRLSRLLWKIYKEAFGSLDITVDQMTLITVVDEVQPIDVNSLADLLCLERTTLVRNLQHLEKKDLITYTNSRPKKICLGVKGEKIMKKIMEIKLDKFPDMMTELDDKDLISLSKIVEKLEK